MKKIMAKFNSIKTNKEYFDGPNYVICMTCNQGVTEFIEAWGVGSENIFGKKICKDCIKYMNKLVNENTSENEIMGVNLLNEKEIIEKIESIGELNENIVYSIHNKFEEIKEDYNKKKCFFICIYLVIFLLIFWTWKIELGAL